jgi:hypothetical protein
MTMRDVTTVDELSRDLVEMVAARVDAAAAGVADLHEVSRRLKLTEEEKSGPLGAAAMAFEYLLGVNDGEFGAMFVMSDGYRYPPDLKDVLPGTWGVWVAVGQQVSVPLARARFNDLCFTGGWGNRGQSARAAVESYLQVAAALAAGGDPDAGPGRALDRVASLQRALTLARKIRDKALADLAITDTVAAAHESLRDASAPPGVVLRLIRILASDRTPPTELDQLLVEARERYRGDVGHSATVIEFQMKRVGADVAARVALQQETIQAWIAEADRTTGLRRMKHLETAIKLARDYGLPALADEATARLQAMSRDDLGLVSRAFQFTLPEDAMEAYFSAFTCASSWKASLELLIAGAPPSGDASANREQAKSAARTALVYAAVSKTRVGGDGLPRFTASSEEERFDWLLAEFESFSQSVRAGMIAEVFRRRGLGGGRSARLTSRPTSGNGPMSPARWPPSSPAVSSGTSRATSREPRT